VFALFTTGFEVEVRSTHGGRVISGSRRMLRPRRDQRPESDVTMDSDPSLAATGILFMRPPPRGLRD
jgi:hypothetical protein